MLTASTMALKTLSAKAAAALDQELMSTGAFSIDQLMELAGLSVSQVTEYSSPVALETTAAMASLLHVIFGIMDTNPRFTTLSVRLAKQLEDLEVEFVDDFTLAVKSADHIVDAVFGFSFSGEVREPFPAVIKAFEDTKLPITSVDAPSSWDIETGPPQSGLGSKFNPAYLVSLTAPKPLAQHFKGRHFVGGRFVSQAIAKKYDFEIPSYQGIDQFVEVGAGSVRKL
ncbi:hypothetical protein EKO27_g7940 [Xylaria grammica]|uniref:NAD(P)H-hydrate epimerase n=1 Tax=Xylaria grammica TaxID=363999 RepID=A0A439CYG7_9PEZI|nr:hypothetical protein EKO27_g7940 [Xylaria grammica]